MSDLAYPKIPRLVQYIFDEDFQEWFYEYHKELAPSHHLLKIYSITELVYLKNDGPVGFLKTKGIGGNPTGYYRISKVYPELEEIKVDGVYVREVTKDFVFFETSAPVDYDGFGTITVAELKPEEGLLNQWGSRKKVCRLVAVRKDAVNWQTMRYASGCYGAVEVKPEFEV